MTSVKQAVAVLKAKLGSQHPTIALILGSSLGKLTTAAEHPLVIPFAKIPGFPRPNVSGHAGNLVVGGIGPNSVVMVDGRIHYYEKGDPAAMRPIIEALSLLGIRILILLNTAGSLMSDVGPGRLTLITDHINFSGANPLIGERGDDRFVPLTDAYDHSLAEAIRRAARAEAIDLAEGTYMWFSGPSFETPAEIRAARALGADVVGMSTVPEVILARRFNLKVAAVSVITNYAAGIKASSPSHTETKLQGARAAADLERLIMSLLDEPLDV